MAITTLESNEGNKKSMCSPPVIFVGRPLMFVLGADKRAVDIKAVKNELKDNHHFGDELFKLRFPFLAKLQTSNGKRGLGCKQPVSRFTMLRTSGQRASQSSSGKAVGLGQEEEDPMSVCFRYYG
jgi:hypothetical protein